MDKPAQWALVAAAWFLALSVALFGFLYWQRLGRVRALPRPVPSVEASVPAPAPVPTPATAICPVTGERVVIGPDTPQVVYRGRTYYFSTDRDAQGDDARTRFLMDPDAWLPGTDGAAR